MLAEEAPLYAGARLGDCRDRGIPTSMDTEEEEAVDTVDMVDAVNVDIEVDTEVDTEAMVDAVPVTEKDSEVVSMNLNMTKEVDTEDTVEVDTLPRSGKQLQEERKQKSEYLKLLLL